MDIDREACRQVWRAYLNGLPSEHPHRLAKPSAFGFGGEPQLADELAELVLAGRKRATTSLPVEYAALQLRAPESVCARLGGGFHPRSPVLCPGICVVWPTQVEP